MGNEVGVGDRGHRIRIMGPYIFKEENTKRGQMNGLSDFVTS